MSMHEPFSVREGIATGSELESWRGFLAKLPEDQPLRDVILASWQRSFAAGLRRDGVIDFQRVDDTELEAILERNRELIDVAKTHLDWISAFMSGTDHVAYVTDRNGIVLYSVGDLAHSDELCLTPGYDWSEAKMGTNGAGTAIAADRPIAVIGAEHFATAFEDCTCTGAPIHRGGEVIGAIDISTSAADAQPDRIALVAHVAFVIDRELALQDEARRQQSYGNREHRERMVLQEANARKERFIAALAHELRSPMAAISAAAEVLTQTPPDSRNVAAAGGVVMRQATHVSSLIEQLMEASRVANMRLKLKRSRVELEDVVRQSIEAVRPAARRKRQKIELTVAAPSPAVHGDRTRLTQLFVNLLDNASRYSGKAKTIRIEAAVSDAEAVVRIRDEGCGIAPEALRNIFDLLFQAEGGHSESGLGLGLSLVRGIVEAHGGRVTAHSDGIGHGSEFVVRLPRVD
ncbi:MAG: GAF domain-containing protein [Gammaproteobacteria bacterium]|nr:GAF domain-containing protein [Gammaproteobacteria bacterium]